jgi:hypothetical protein
MAKQRLFAILLVLFTLMATTGTLTSQARSYNAHARRYAGGTYFQRHPYQKTGLIGAGAGAVAGGVLFGDKHRGRNLVRGATLGAAAGLGYQYLKKRGTFK